MILGQLVMCSGRVDDVEAVQPWVAGHDHVHEEADGPGFAHTVDHLRLREGAAPDEPWGTPASARCLGRALGVARDDLGRGHGRAFAHLQVVEVVDEDSTGRRRQTHLPALFTQ
jgi:hypothetical protein